MLKRISAIVMITLLSTSLAACGNSNSSNSSDSTSSSQASSKTTSKSGTEASNTSADSSSVFTDRDLKQEADTSNAKKLTLSDGKDVTITEEGVYIISGTAKDASVIVDAADDAKVQLVLENANITNSDSPCVYVKNADKVFVTTANGSENTLTVSGSFTADGDTKTDAVIFSKDDIVLNGEGTLNISSTDNGISGKDDIKITGGTININCTADAIEANDSISVADGNITIKTQKDGLHAENDDDNTQGSIYISSGTFNITAGSDGIQATTTAVIDGGTFTISSAEGIEATNITINDGNITISASDDGINAANKSTAESVCITINGGNIKITMGQGDTDGIDSNGDLYITGGTVDITGQSACDYDGKAEKTGGKLIVNGQETDTIPNQMMGGHGGMGGGPGKINGDMGGMNGDMGGFQR